MRPRKGIGTIELVWPGTSDTAYTIAEADHIDVPVTHELGADLAGGVIERIQWVAPSKRPTRVKVVSEVVTETARRLQSTEYVATVRRRKAQQLAKDIAALERDAARVDFAVCTYPVVKKLNELLDQLLDAEQEGNTREILRQMRNTFLNGGWNRYRDPNARKTAVEILSDLGTHEEVTSQHARSTFHRLMDNGMKAVGMPLFDYDDEDGDNGGQDQIPD